MIYYVSNIKFIRIGAQYYYKTLGWVRQGYYKYSHPCIETFLTSKSKIHSIIVKPMQCSLCSKFKMYYSCFQFVIPINDITWYDFLLLFCHTSVSFQSIYSGDLYFSVFSRMAIPILPKLIIFENINPIWASFY